MLTPDMKHLAIIDLWPSGAVLASDVGSTADAVKKWRKRGIPPKHFASVVKAARKRRYGVSLSDLHGVAA